MSTPAGSASFILTFFPRRDKTVEDNSVQSFVPKTMQGSLGRRDLTYVTLSDLRI